MINKININLNVNSSACVSKILKVIHSIITYEYSRLLLNTEARGHGDTGTVRIVVVHAAHRVHVDEVRGTRVA